LSPGPGARTVAPIVTLSRDTITGPGVPKTIGPYSPGVRAGDVLYVSGQPGVDPESGAIADGFAAQARQAMRNVESVLRAGGSGLPLVVNTTVIVADIAEFPVVNEVFAEAFPADPPARMVIQAPLPHGLLISIGCVAVAGPATS
jgi:2-iminobutanoate/2-iminopropanoate deaminase